MANLEEAFRDAAGEVAQIKAQPSNRYWWLYGTIKAKNSNGTLDVAIDGVTIRQVKATVSCMMANAGDRAIVLKAGPLMTCVDVIATSDKASIPASSITGTLPASSLPTASTTAKGIMQAGSGLTVSGGIVSVDNGDYVKLAAGAFADDDGKNGVILFRWGPLRVIQVQFAHVARGGTVFGHLPDSEVPRGGIDVLGYLYVQGVEGTCGQVKVNYEGEVSGWLDRDSNYCSGQVAFFV